MHSMSCMPPPASYASCLRLKKGSEHAKLLEPRRRVCVLRCAVVIIKHAETAGAVLRHKVDWPSLRGGRLGGRLPGHRVEI